MCHRSNRRLLDLHRNALHHDSIRTHNAHDLPAQDEQRGDHRLHEYHPLSEGTAAGSASERERETDLGQGQWTETESVPERGEQGAADLGVPEDQVLSTDFVVHPLLYAGAEVVHYQEKEKGRESRRGGGIESERDCVKRRKKENESENKGRGRHPKIPLLHTALHHHPLPPVRPLQPHPLLKDR